MPESFTVAGFPLRRMHGAPLSRDAHVAAVGVPERFRDGCSFGVSHEVSTLPP